MAFQLFPSFSFDESNVGPRPVRTAMLDRIGLVGVFSRGPAVPTIVGPQEARTLYGFDNTEGSAHLQAILDQGATDLVISRVLTHSSAAKQTGTIIVEGTAADDSILKVTLKLDLADDGAYNAEEFNISVASGAVASDIASDVISAVNLASDYFLLAAGVAAGSIVISTKENTTNSAKAEFDLTLVDGFSIKATAGGAAITEKVLSGGAVGPTAAQAVIRDEVGGELIQLEAIWPGATGNSIILSVKPGFEDQTIDLELTLPDPVLGTQFPQIKEVYKGMSLTDLYDEDKLTALQSSNLVRGKLVGAATATCETIEDNATPFVYGSDGNPAGPTLEDYTAALDALDNVQCTVLVAPGIKPTLSDPDIKSLNEQLVTKANNSGNEMGELFGLRIAVIGAPKGMKVSDLAGLKSSNKIPNSNRVVMVAGWGTSARLPKYKRFGIDPAAVYAGHLVMTPAQISPAARTSSPFIRGLTEVDTPIGNSAHNQITMYKLDAIVLDPVTGGLHMLNGRSTSSDNAWYWICFRRVYDRIRMDIFFNFQFIKSEPSSKQMDTVIQDSINAYLDSKMRERLINGYNAAVSNDSNNPPAVRASGIRYVDFAIEPLFPNDFVQFNIARVLQASVRLA